MRKNPIIIYLLNFNKYLNEEYILHGNSYILIEKWMLHFINKLFNYKNLI